MLDLCLSNSLHFMHIIIMYCFLLPVTFYYVVFIWLNTTLGPYRGAYAPQQFGTTAYPMDTIGLLLDWSSIKNQLLLCLIFHNFINFKRDLDQMVFLAGSCIWVRPRWVPYAPRLLAHFHPMDMQYSCL